MSIPFIDAIRGYLQGDGAVILPEMVLTLFGLAVLLIGYPLDESVENNWFWKLLFKNFYAKAALAGTLFSGFTLWKLRGAVAGSARGYLPGFHESVVVDSFFLFFATLFLAATALVILLSVKYLDIEEEQEGEYYALLLFACVGMMFMASGVDLIVMFLGLETMALSFYVLTGFLRREKRSNEASLKYVLLGAFSSGILAYGFSLIYGLSGTTNIRNISAVFNPRIGLARAIELSHQSGVIGNQMREVLSAEYPAALHLEPSLLHQMPVLAAAAFVLIAVGLFFKVAAVPFHQWAPDVCERGFQDRQFRTASAVVSHRVRSLTGDLDVSHRGCGGRLVDLGQPRRPHANQREAPAGLFLDRACGLHPARTGCLERNRIHRHCLLLARLCVHDRGRVRGGHRASAKGTDRRRARRLERFVPAQPGFGIVASDLHAFPRGHSADRQLHGQVFHLSVADRNEASRPRCLRRALYRSRTLLLLPHRRARLAQGARRSAASGDEQRASRSPRRRRVCFARRRVVS